MTVAVEIAHVFTLIHDDLPAMDNADVRRGRPSNHAAHGEAMAILAGDALLSLAFELTARPTCEASGGLAMVSELAASIGWRGVIGGQVTDIQIQADEILKTRDALDAILAKHCKQTVEKIAADTDRDFYMNAEESKAYGIVDEVLNRPPGDEDDDDDDDDDDDK